METVSGAGNWYLTISRGDSGISILRASTCNVKAVLPDELFGLPVTVLGSRALKPDASALEGEQLRTVCGRAEGEYDNRRIQELTMPRYLKSIGEYAFMNCSSMHTLELCDEIDELSSTALMNCRSLKSIKLTRSGAEQGIALHSIVSGLPRELDVEILSPGSETVRLVFPEYYELYTEIGPSHFFNYNIEGGGFPYHHVFINRKLDLSAYDALWDSYLAADHDSGTALRLAWQRLRCPAGLSEAAEKAYSAYIAARMGQTLELVLSTKDISGLNLLLSGRKLSAEDLDSALKASRDMNYTEATAILLEKKHGSFSGGRNRSFEL